ncbi:MAG: aspartate kinase [Bacteroidales bacterium]|nr:aspartate kinase [Bacteroidales bacterium]MBN2758541.1 aspartate kinase [Bacteroidales bacterium]
MLVFKFGGASVKNAVSVKNLFSILNKYTDNQIIVVVSAMGKITSALESILDKYFNKSDFKSDFDILKNFHLDIISELFEDDYSDIYSDFNLLISELENRLSINPSSSYDYEYDQIVSFGEIFSTKIVSEYLKFMHIKNEWIDIRKFLKTDSIYRDAKINWELSERLLKNEIDFTQQKIYLTQGFIASNQNNNVTTLGREGSDFTAAVLAYVFDAEKLIIWKDVEGVFNSDPNEYKDVIKLDSISFTEAVELAYYGAKIIHPKTIKPLQNKNIVLEVKSFKNPEKQGTIISNSTENNLGVSPNVPIYIAKNNQILISIAPRDFSFIAEENLSNIFYVLAKYRVKVNLLQNSAVSFSICVDYDKNKVDAALSELNQDYKVLYNLNLTLITIRHYDSEIINEMTNKRKIFVQQKSRHTARFVVD